MSWNSAELFKLTIAICELHKKKLVHVRFVICQFFFAHFSYYFLFIYLMIK